MKLKQIRVDGYKNLIDCVVNLGDFNVLIGPNNSGKSNLLEAVQIIWPMCFGDEELRKRILKGLTPCVTTDSSICHLKKHKNKPMNIGIAFELIVEQKIWAVDYKVTVQCDDSRKGNGYFILEKLTAKDPSKRGPARKYFLRRDNRLEVNGKEHKIAKDNSSLLAINSLYPDYEGLPLELGSFVNKIKLLAMTSIFSISPVALRSTLYEEKSVNGIKVSSFDLLLIADNIQKEGKYYNLFKESLCDILDLEDVHFEAEDMPRLSEKEDAKERTKRMRLLAIKRMGDRYSLIEEYSDGTLVVVAILEALLSENERGPILCLEELENCLHPAAVEKLLRFLQDHSNDWPVLITTHSPYLLNGIRPEDVNVAVVDETGATHFEKVKNSRQLRKYLNKNLMSFGELLANDFQGFREG